MGRLKNVLIVTVSLAIPAGAYTVLYNRRLERRLPVVKRQDFPTHVLTLMPAFGVHPKINYSEAWYVDIPSSRFRKSQRPAVEEFARVLFTTLPVQAEWSILSFLDEIGLNPFEKRIYDNKTNLPAFSKGRTLLDGTYMIEKGIENKAPTEILYSYWTTPSNSRLILGGINGIACEQIGPNMTRVWFVSHLAVNAPSDILVADEATKKSPLLWGRDPLVMDANGKDVKLDGLFLSFLWLHRLYCRAVIDFSVRNWNQAR